ncbi:thyroid receptor-interacting protein 13 [Salpingoeca rosetta]|uniref:Thyroid receptor-interacting protein 13 n=1 Tax=Salpingoeca rosetta (strain ATCC 50818 / BSB-021) TaxID=946362 RepID=F2TZY7_SALR5|nr:thyroid receptor-interacting protein 13 [Salpingoeca rosetta]EGD80715.1 thyroid receptor-interacting protein 13 [Salpingoeca rosetta]|eukprot:XP_004997276.1 thyroid receptor-interacting protein 13 [Salpingoeca rosetta]
MLTIEVCLADESLVPEQEIEGAVGEVLGQLRDTQQDSCADGFDKNSFVSMCGQHPVLTHNATSIRCSGEWVPGTEPSVCVYRLHTDGAVEEHDAEEEVTSALQWVLPAAEFDNLWDTLIYDTDVKQNLLSFATTTLLFSDHNVNPDIISWNRVVLLHGPPGTGKTTLCKALAQKLTIRFCKRFSHGQLIEINSHSLFSKWFSESGKLVGKMFQSIRELIENEDSFVCVLIDEVESLAAARRAATSGTEPSDAIRVVNALLTQIDQLKTYKNVLILTTSNITEAIDVAFVDRADLKFFIGLPGINARYQILSSCVRELMRTGLVQEELLMDVKSLEDMEYAATEATRESLKLLELARLCEGLSGRMLRKLPFLAFARLQAAGEAMPLAALLEALRVAIEREHQSRQSLMA